MKVQVKLFAAAKESAQADSLTIEVPAGATIADLRNAAAAQCPPLAAILPHCLWAVGANYADDHTELTEQSEVALIPPVSGG